MLIERRDFFKTLLQTLAATTLALPKRKGFAAPNLSNPKIAKQVIVLGIDGMDPQLLLQFVKRGEMPTFAKLMREGYWGPLQTTTPPQSPVAWSSFISGVNPGGHGIFDFIHRDPSTFAPFLSTSRSYDSDRVLKLGDWQIPLKAGRVEMLRKGPAFWTFLEEKDIPATLFSLPADFPVQPGKAKIISGMGTPDLLGGYGTFTLFTDAEIPNADHFTGGRIVKLQIVDHAAKAVLHGPPNTMRKERIDSAIPVSFRRDPWEKVVKIDIQDHQLLFSEGEWSDWIPLKFELMPLFATVAGMVRIYVQQVFPNLRIYFSPLNIDPMESHVPISNPYSYSQELSQAVGRFYTQGFPEDTKALSNGIFSDEEFLVQSRYVLQERLRLYEHELSRFQEGLFFFYFSSIDQNSHMMLRTMDPTHSQYNAQATREVKDAIYFFYRAMDDVLRQAWDKMKGNSTLLLLSDHGFAPFTREFNTSSWLVENGFTVLKDPSKARESVYFDGVDWKKTKAFVLGLNAVYINLAGREVHGSVSPAEAPKIKQEIINRLNLVVDPNSGRKVIHEAFDAEKIYSGPFAHLAPDIVVGYERGFRISDEAVLGKFPAGIFQHRLDKWSADHCVAPSLVPGVLLTSEPLVKKDPAIWDLAPSILRKFGLEIPGEMEGKSIFS
ncbi:MAG: hypothetical protein EHM72_08555 [Calditrichaeota bacterium]|nr:MAG: hypothetical protein EHM72_08555 [Calditrichota bacterium]